MAGTLVFSEQGNGKVKRVALEATSAARSLQSRVGGDVIAVIIGVQVADEAKILTVAGADKVYLAEDPLLGYYSSEGYASLISGLAEKLEPSLILMGATTMGKDLGPKLAARLGGSFAGDCVGLEIDDEGKLVAQRPIYGGKIMSRVKSHQNIFQVATIRPNIFPVEKQKTEHFPQIKKIKSSCDFSNLPAQVKEVVTTVSSKVELTEARIIVSGGRGLKGPENFNLVEDLAEALGAAVGASRAAVDAGWKPHSYQVGLTGKTVSPLLYIACGISGAVQHLAGMSSSKYIVAINKDPNAPIFKVANYGIVGDIFEILPLLTKAVKKTREG
ncbi:MAG: electron transfer flavoprotein subunit alpha/FixB family protein [Nitrospiria bacterium]